MNTIVGPVRYRVSLLALFLLFSASAGFAEDAAKVGVSVQKDKNDNIHVIVDPSLITKLQANRQDGKITMVLPKEQADAVEVDRILKDAKVVEVTNTVKGRQVIINTDAVYWDVKPVAPEKPAARHSAVTKLAPLHMAKTAGHHPASALSSKPVSPASKARVPEKQKQNHPASNRVASVADAQRQKLNGKSAPKKNNPPKKQKIAAVAKLAEMKKTIAKKITRAVSPKPRHPKRSVALSKTRVTLHVPGDHTTQSDYRPVAFAAVSEPVSKASGKTPAIPEPVSGIAENENAASSASNPKDEESALLDWDESKTAKAPGGFGFADLFRIVASLLVVLALLVGFMKWVLPRMVANGYFQKKEAPLQFGRRLPKKGAKAKGDKDNEPEEESTAPRSFRDLSGLASLKRASENPQVKARPSATAPATPKPYATTPIPKGAWQPPSERYADPNRAWEKYPPLRKSEAHQPEVIPPRPSQTLAGYSQPSTYTAAQETYPHQTHPARQAYRSRPLDPEPAHSIHNGHPSAARQALVKDSPQRAFIERLGEEEEGFQILNSAKIDKSKELHLIEIRGRQLVLATTPYSVSLVTELAGGNMIPLENSAAFLAETAKKVQDSQDIYKKYLSSERSQKRQEIYNDYTREDRYTDPSEVIVLDDYDDVFKR